MFRRATGSVAASLLLATAAATGLGLALWPMAKAPRTESASDAAAPAHPSDEALEEDDVLSFRVPNGKPARISCEDAHIILGQARGELLAYAPSPVAPSALASGVSDWMDPYGLWTASSDSPAAAAIDTQAPKLIEELEATGGGCPAAMAIGSELVAWVGQLEIELDRARHAAGPLAAPRPWAEPLAEISRDDEPARELARDLGKRLGEIERALGPKATAYADQAAARYLPSLSAHAWSEVALAAAVRAYVPLVDPHGAWAPDGEESSVYDLDLEAHPPERAWIKASRTSIGIRIDDGARAPLENGDVVLEIDGLATGALPPEQVEQLSFHAANADVGIVRIGARGSSIERVSMSPAPRSETALTSESPDPLKIERIAYGAGAEVAVVSIADVPDDLGDRFERALEEATHGPKPTVGIVIDLRGNGGGSTEGAIDVLGQLIPGAPLFPMKRRDGTLETDHAPAPPSGALYTGPLATLVDPGTASAAEMIAGALGAYHRAPIVGTPTYGKGCAQEYADDAAHTGVLRLTTLLYALPDGSAVQRVGLKPWARVPFVAQDLEPSDREATLPHAPPSWSGPDVRDLDIVKKSEIAWPSPHGTVGPCADARECDAIAMLPTATRAHDSLRSPTARGR